MSSLTNSPKGAAIPFLWDAVRSLAFARDSANTLILISQPTELWEIPQLVSQPIYPNLLHHPEWASKGIALYKQTLVAGGRGDPEQHRLGSGSSTAAQSGLRLI